MRVIAYFATGVIRSFDGIDSIEKREYQPLVLVEYFRMVGNNTGERPEHILDDVIKLEVLL